jgi:glycosyltransferase involved in cell wall biosynthesis
MFRRQEPVVCVTNWLATDDNQYLDRLTAALRAAGVTPVPIRPAPGVIVRTFARGSRVVHVHWPEYLVRPFTTSRRDAALNAARLARLAAGVVTCRLLRVRIVWTVHNLGPHEADASWAAFRAYELVARAADVFVVHSRAAARRVEARFPRSHGRVLVAPHGHYRGAHPQAAAGRAEVRARYGVPPGAFLLLAFGQVRRYKRLAELARAVAAARDGDVHLLVAGAALEGDLERELESVAANGGRVHLDLRRIPAQEVSELHAAADAAVFNHAELFSSGALLLALSQGLPVVTTASEAAVEVAGWPALSTFASAEDLVAATRRLRAVDDRARRSAATAAADAASWERAAAALRDAYAIPSSSRTSPSFARRSE